jgi:putative PIN family toxin of toxin-antitoxin system
VLDSSVLVAAYISRAGVCADLLEDILMDHEWVISHYILDELVRKLKEKFGFPDSEIAEIHQSILGAAETVEPAEVHPESCRDPNDLPVLGTAVAGRADVLITVDKDLLDLKAHCGIPIIRPGEFWRRIEPNSSSPGTATASDDQDTPAGQPASEI